MVDKSLPFAQALLSIGQETGQEDGFLQDFSVLETVEKQNPDLVLVLRHPGIPSAQKEKLLVDILSGSVSASFLDFVKIACRHHMAGFLAQMDQDYRKLLDESRHIQTVRVESAAPLDEAQKEKLSRALEAKLGGPVRLECVIRPDLIAGMKITSGDAVMDASYQGLLNKMKEQLDKS